MPSKGLLLLNLGSPAAPEKAAVARYLNEFLMDPYVVDIPWALRWPLVHGLITPFRAEKSAAAYRQVWTPNGSPLVEFTRQFAEGVRHALTPKFDVRWGMRYGKPSLAEAFRDWNVDEIFAVPLYPQYAESSTRSAFDHIRVSAARAGSKARLHLLEDFHAEDEFITIQARRIAEQAAHFKPDQVLLSFHGLPEHHVTKLHPQHCLQSGACCDSVTVLNRSCYRAQAHATARALRERIPLAPDKITIAFQSRLGRRPWIKPYTDIVIADMARLGVKRVLVSCPSFVADCLETLEEIQLRLREQFLAAGGEALEMVPALNGGADWVQAFSRMVEKPGLRWTQ